MKRPTAPIDEKSLYVYPSKAEEYMDHLEKLLRRSVEAIDNLVDAMPMSDSERDWTIAQGEGVVADIRAALGGQDETRKEPTA